MKRQVLFIFLLLIPFLAHPQGGFNKFFVQTQKINTTGVYVLGGWALANLASGAVGWSQTANSSKYFYQMNFLWNTVNLGVAGLGYYAISQMTPLRMNPQELMEAHLRFEKLYLINAGLDIAYAGSGLILKHLSVKIIAKEDILKGYGNSFLLQGGFLFTFDTVMYFLQQNHRYQFLHDMNFTFLQDGMQLRYTYLF